MGCADASSAIALAQDVGELTERGWDGTWKGRGWLRGQDVDGLMGGGANAGDAAITASEVWRLSLGFAHSFWKLVGDTYCRQ